MTAYVALAANVALLSLLAALAWRLRDRVVLSILLWTQCLYWGIAYIGRALVLLTVRPVPRVDDALADPRLFAGSFSYFSSLPPVLWIVNGGLAIYVCSVWIAARKLGNAARDHREQPGHLRDCSGLLAWTTYGFGWTCRLAMYSHLVAGPLFGSVVTSLALFGPLGAGLLLVRAATAQTRAWFVGLALSLLGAELAYSAMIQSKAPALSVLLFTALGFALRGWKISRALGLGSVTAFVALFPLLQALKESPAVSDDIAAAAQHYPALWRPFLPLLRRFDLLSASTDALYFPGERWLGGQYLLRVVHGLLPFATPAEWVPYGTAGLSWAGEIRSRSLPNAGLSVSLAEGFIAEGYVWLGWAGIAILAVLVAVLTVTLSGMIGSARPFYFSLAILLLSQPTIFERGILGIAEAVGQAAQAAIAFAVLWWLLDGRTAGRQDSRPVDSEPKVVSLNSRPTTLG